ncbi:zinc transporter ZntB [Altererythrobacter sp. SALINAS58]|uniref:CorA family divalent cation transporter n=1 Tax=Alteripontixanthobacter muriae TaxID=2705546 RepID=UPI0015769142|nr:CorA family divalent cation transporter [Alteripontixanthobacter muriae]NTZ43335.1 zinc transporter ZntB [Alteripontixanthobacter muriae]
MVAKADSVSIRAWVLENDVVAELPLDELANYRGDGFVWLHVDGAGRNGSPDLSAFVPGHAANALLASETRPRCDEADDAALINLRGTGREATIDTDRLVSIRVWVEARRVTSVTRNTLGALSKVEAAMRAGRLRDGGDFVSALAQAISIELDPKVAALGDRLDECEGEIENGDIYVLRRNITALRSQAIAFRRFVAPDRDALSTMAQLEFGWISKEDRMHLREAADRFARMAEELEAVRERAALLHEQLTDLRAEIVDRRSLAIAIVAFIFLPLTFITGLLGMNVEGIPFAQKEWAFWGVLGFCLVVALIVLGWFALRRWLED